MLFSSAMKNQISLLSFFTLSLFLFLQTGPVGKIFAQLQVTPVSNATQLANMLAGQGVTLSNIKMNCKAGASGTFNGASSNVGIASGVLLTSGQVSIAPGPNNTSSAGQSNATQFNDPDLLTIDPTAYFDPCILEFDVIPTCNVLSFSFVFGSEEYHDYVNTSCNDVFGIFVTGQNPSGPAYTGYNMAKIPLTTQPVSINTVNNGNSWNCASAGPCTNCNYFKDNCGGATVQYDGLTTAITVTLTVAPCTPYHFKLAVSDACDGIFDSGVFFQAASLTCNPLPMSVTTTTTPASCAGNNGTATATPTGGTAPYTYIWTPSGQSTQTATGLAPGTYSVLVVDATGCFNATNNNAVVAGGGSFTTSSSQTNVTCFGGSNGSATITPAGGTAPYTYLWTPSGAATATAGSLAAGNYSVTVTDAGGCVQNAQFTITEPAAITATITNTTPVSCFGGMNGSVAAAGGGGAAPYLYSWNTSPVQVAATASNLPAGTYSATITDANGCTAITSATITEPPGMSLTASSTPASCGKADGTANVAASGGQTPYSFMWLTNPVQVNASATNLAAGNYSVIVTDANGCTQFQSAAVTGGVPPAANFSFTPETLLVTDPQVSFSDLSLNTSSWFWNFGDGNSDTVQNPSHTYADTGTYCITLTVQDAAKNCLDSITKCLRIDAPFTFFIPNAFTPNGDGINEQFFGKGTFIKEFEMHIFDRWGNQIFESDNLYKGWDGKVRSKGDLVLEDVYVWKVRVTDFEGKKYNYNGHVSVVK